MGTTVVFIEHSGGTARRASLETLGAAKAAGQTTVAVICDPDAGDFTIRSNSPCAPPGLTGCGLVGALDVGCGPVSVDEASWGKIKAAYRVGGSN